MVGAQPKGFSGRVSLDDPSKIPQVFQVLFQVTKNSLKDGREFVERSFSMCQFTSDPKTSRPAFFSAAAG